MSENTPLDERITQMLTEARVVLPAVQALLGFQLANVISQSFEKLPAGSKAKHAGSPGCITLAVILLIAPRPPIIASSSRDKRARRCIASEAGSSPVPPYLWPLGSLRAAPAAAPAA
jgi:hypothetical protein